MELIEHKDNKYRLLRTINPEWVANCQKQNIKGEQLAQYFHGDVILKYKNIFYIAEKCIEVEFKEIEEVTECKMIPKKKESSKDMKD